MKQALQEYGLVEGSVKVMVVNQKPTGTAKSMPIGLAYGWGTSVGVTALLCALLAILILNGKIGWETAGYGAIVMIAGSAYVGAAVSCRMIKHRKLIVCLMSGAIYLCTLLGTTALLFGRVQGSMWVTVMLIVGGTTAAALVHSAEKKSPRQGRRKRRL